MSLSVIAIIIHRTLKIFSCFQEKEEEENCEKCFKLTNLDSLFHVYSIFHFIFHSLSIASKQSNHSILSTLCVFHVVHICFIIQSIIIIVYIFFVKTLYLDKNVELIVNGIQCTSQLSPSDEGKHPHFPLKISQCTPIPNHNHKMKEITITISK